MNGKRLSDAVTIVFTLCAVAVVSALVHREYFPRTQARELHSRSIVNWEAYANTGQRVGPQDASVTITEFSDYQCPFCRTFSFVVDSVMQHHGGKVAHVYRHFPNLRLHPHAMNASRASLCAGKQGAFQPMHALLFKEQEVIGIKPWATFASEAGVAEIGLFEHCMRDTLVTREIERDMKAGRELGVNGTPTFLVNEVMIVGALKRPVLDSIIEASIRRQESTRGNPTR